MAFEQWDKSPRAPMPPAPPPNNIAANALRFQQVRDKRRENARKDDIRDTMGKYFSENEEPTNKGMGEALSKRGHTNEAYRYLQLDQQRSKKSNRSRKILPMQKGDGTVQDYVEGPEGGLEPWGNPYKTKKGRRKGSVSGSATEKEVDAANSFVGKYYGDDVAQMGEDDRHDLDSQVANGARYIQRQVKDEGGNISWTEAMNLAAKQLRQYIDPGKTTDWLDFELDQAGSFKPPMGATGEELYGNGQGEEDFSSYSAEELEAKAREYDAN